MKALFSWKKIRKNDRERKKIKMKEIIFLYLVVKENV